MATDRENSGGQPREMGATADAEGMGGPSVINPGRVYFTFMVDCAVHEGYISQEGADAVLQALYPEVRS